MHSSNSSVTKKAFKTTAICHSNSQRWARAHSTGWQQLHNTTQIRSVTICIYKRLLILQQLLSPARYHRSISGLTSIHTIPDSIQIVKYRSICIDQYVWISIYRSVYIDWYRQYVYTYMYSIIVQYVQIVKCRSVCIDRYVQIGIYRSICVDRLVQIFMYRSVCIDRYVQIDMYRSTCMNEYVQISM